MILVYATRYPVASAEKRQNPAGTHFRNQIGGKACFAGRCNQVHPVGPTVSNHWGVKVNQKYSQT